MSVVSKVAWRNIWRYKGKSLIIGIILIVGTFIMTVGNGIISGMEKGLNDNIPDLFTGDIVLISDEQQKNQVLFEMMGTPIKVIKNYQQLEKILQKEEMIEDFLPVAAGTVLLFNPGSELYNIMLIGIDIEKYLSFFPDSIQITAGKMLEPGERGILISEYTRDSLYDLMDYWLLPENEELNESQLPTEDRDNYKELELRKDVVFMGISTSNSALDVKVPVKGIMKYKALNQLWGNYSLVDIESFREAHNYVTGQDSLIKLSPEDESLLSTESMDALFSFDSIMLNLTVTEENLSYEMIQEEMIKEDNHYVLDTGSFNMIFVRLKEGVAQKEAINRLNGLFRENNIAIRAISWADAMGTVGSMAGLIKASLNIFIIFIFIVASIVIMNTLTMAAVERIPELGMMRAVGARKGFLRRMFISETVLISAFFGGIGILSGIGIIHLIKQANITTTNELLQMIYGGNKLYPVISLYDLLFGIIELFFVTFLSVIYPLKLVGKIVPLDAIARE